MFSASFLCGKTYIMLLNSMLYNILIPYFAITDISHIILIFMSTSTLKSYLLHIIIMIVEKIA